MNSKLLLFYNVCLRQWPSHFMSRVRVAYLRCCGAKIGPGVIIENDVVIRGNGRLSVGAHTELKGGAIIECCGGTIIIGSNSEINRGSIVAGNCGSTITIGNDVHVAHYCSIKGSTHRINIKAIHCNTGSIAGESDFKDIQIGDGCWLCAGCIILPGVKVGRYNVVAAGAVVTKDSPDNALLAGVPAAVKKLYV